MRLKIPHYTPRATGTYICEDDSALDTDRIKRECAELEKAGRAPAEHHPIFLYWRGVGRFDLDAVMDFDGQQVRPRDYIIGEDPELWTVRRLTWAEFNDVERIGEQRTQALRACRYGLAAVEGSSLELAITNGMLTDATMQALHDIDPDLPVTLGYCVLLLNRGPTAAEKKSSALGV